MWFGIGLLNLRASSCGSLARYSKVETDNLVGKITSCLLLFDLISLIIIFKSVSKPTFSSSVDFATSCSTSSLVYGWDESTNLATSCSFKIAGFVLGQVAVIGFSFIGFIPSGISEPAITVAPAILIAALANN